MSESSTPLVQSLSRGLLILSWLAEQEDGLSLADLAERLGVSRSTAFNLAATLAAHGFVTKTSRPVRYRLGPAVGVLHDRHEAGRWRVTVEEELRSLAAELPDCYVIFCENTGGDIRVTLRLDPARPGVVERGPTRPITPYVMALSLAYLAFCGGEDRREYMRRYPFAEYGQGRWGSPGCLEEALANARHQGFLELGHPSLWRVVVPLRRPGEQLSGLLCVSRHGGDDEGITELLPGIRNSVVAVGRRINGQEE